MEVISINKGKTFLLNRWPNVIKKDQLTYFIYGEGYKKTKSFKVLPDVSLPDRREKLSWLELCKIHDQYGIEVSSVYAECKTAGIIARQTIKGYYAMYSKIKDIIPDNFDEFFDLLRVDYMLSCFGMYSFDIVRFDSNMDQIDPDYDSVNCKYMDKECSISEYIRIKYGDLYCTIIDRLL